MLHYGVTRLNSQETKERDATAKDRTKYKGYIFISQEKKRM